ncbi:MAG TPA: peptidase C39, partial [Maribacter sp.]|nr:peptidase C39 [Maribacter sp.]
MEAMINHGAPVILHVILEQRIQHYVVCYGFRDGMFTVGDPAKGITHLTVDELKSIWESKTCLTLSPNKDFVKSTTTVKIKKAWLRDLIKDDLRLLTISAVIGVVIAVLGMSMAIFSKKLIDDILPSNELE